MKHILRLFYITDMLYAKLIKHKQPWNSGANFTTILTKSGNFPTPSNSLFYYCPKLASNQVTIGAIGDFSWYFRDRRECTCQPSGVPASASAATCATWLQFVKDGRGLVLCGKRTLWSTAEKRPSPIRIKLF